MSTETQTIMPFGKHRGTAIAEIPVAYLKWLADTVDLREPLRTVVASVLRCKAEQMPLSVSGSTTLPRSVNVAAPTLPPVHSEGFSGGSPYREAAKPKRAWIITLHLEIGHPAVTLRGSHPGMTQ
jgi:hypothetical protein